MFEGIKNVGVLEDNSKDKERKVNISKELAKHTSLGSVAGKKFERTVAKMKEEMSNKTVDMKKIMNQQNEKKQESVSTETKDNSSQIRLTRQILNKLGLKK